MQTIKLEGTIYLNPSTNFQPYGFIQVDFDSKTFWKDPDRIKIAPYTIEIEMPDDFDPTQEIIASLQRQRTLILADNEQRLNYIDGKIQELLAIEHK